MAFVQPMWLRAVAHRPMRWFSTRASGPSQLGIRQVEQEYRHRLSCRILEVRVSLAALLIASLAQVALIATFVAKMSSQRSWHIVEHIASFLGATMCVLPVTVFMVRIYALSRAHAREARSQLSELEIMMKRRSEP